MLCAQFQNDSVTSMDIIKEPGITRFWVSTIFRRDIHYCNSCRLVLGQFPNSIHHWGHNVHGRIQPRGASIHKALRRLTQISWSLEATSCVFALSYHSDILQAPRQYYPRDACQISERLNNYNIIIVSRGIEISQNLVIWWLIVWWIEGQLNGRGQNRLNILYRHFLST